MNKKNEFRIFDAYIWICSIDAFLGLLIEEQSKYKGIIEGIEANERYSIEKLAVGALLVNFECKHKVPQPIFEGEEIIDFRYIYVEDIHEMDNDIFWGKDIRNIEQPDIFSDIMNLEKHLGNMLDTEEDLESILKEKHKNIVEFNKLDIGFRRRILNDFCMDNIDVDNNLMFKDIMNEYNVFENNEENISMLVHDISSSIKNIQKNEKQLLKIDSKLCFEIKSAVNDIKDAFKDNYNIEKMTNIRKVLQGGLLERIIKLAEIHDEEYKKHHFIFRKSKELDVEDIMNIINDAKAYFKEQGIDQWQNGYPNKDTILNDINNESSYVIEKNKDILGTVMYSLEEESTYNSIYNGKWLTNDKYAVMHRIAVNDKHKGSNIAAQILKYIEMMSIENDVHSIKIDTHKDNISMQKFLKKNGFEYCGEIYLNDGSLRIAFEKLI